MLCATAAKLYPNIETQKTHTHTDMITGSVRSNSNRGKGRKVIVNFRCHRQRRGKSEEEEKHRAANIKTDRR